MDIDVQRLDADLFLRPDLEENQALLKRAEVVELGAGTLCCSTVGCFTPPGVTRRMQSNCQRSLLTIKVTIARNRIRAQIAFPALMWWVLTLVNSLKLGSHNKK